MEKYESKAEKRNSEWSKMIRKRRVNGSGRVSKEKEECIKKLVGPSENERRERNK